MLTATAGREMAKKDDGARKRGAKKWADRKGLYTGAQLFREDVDRMTVLANATRGPDDKRLSVAKWFRAALGPTLEELYEEYVRSLAPSGRRPEGPPRAASA
jgi:hypothetical protein